jgi:DNA primase
VLNRHIDKPAVEKRVKPQVAKSTYSPVRQAITMLIQHPELHQDAIDVAKINWMTQPGLPILVNLLETLQDSPHLTTAQLLERWRDNENGPHLQKLAQQPLSLSLEELKPEFIGIMQQLEQQAIELRQQYLISKPFSQMSEAEREELNLLNKRFLK